MPNKALVTSIGALVSLVVVIAWMAGYFNDRIEPGTEPLVSQQLEPIHTVNQITLPLQETVSANISPEETTLISSRILARITELKVRAGQQVSRGDLLIKLEQSDLLARARQAREQIAAIEARNIEAAANLDRAKTLFAQKLIARADLDQAIAAHDELIAARSAAKLALEDAETAVTYSEIRAPISGRIVNRLAEPGDTATPGIPLLSLYNPTSLQAEAQVREGLAVALNVGDPITIEVPSLGTSFDAAIVEIIPAANPGSRSFQVKARFDYDSRLLPGMYAKMLIPAGQQDAIVIPTELVAHVGQLNIAWILERGNRQQRLLRLGDEVDNGVIVVAGLQGGERLLSTP